MLSVKSGQITGSISQVPGNFHVSTHAAGVQNEIPNFQHIVHQLHFGDSLEVSQKFIH